jgi:AcrR family transcriptional regulator
MSTASDTGESARATPAREGSTPRGAGREAITSAAREVFAERGFHGASIRDIARRAGLSLSALYHWHAGKQELLAALIEQSAQDYLRACDVALASAGGDPATRLRTAVAVTVEYRVRQRLESQIANREWRNLDPPHQRRLAGCLEPATVMWNELITAGVASGQFDCPHPDDARRTIVSACNAISQWYDPDGEIGLAELSGRYVDIAMRVVGHKD